MRCMASVRSQRKRNGLRQYEEVGTSGRCELLCDASLRCKSVGASLGRDELQRVQLSGFCQGDNVHFVG
jgi:hypothetical protein